MRMHVLAVLAAALAIAAPAGGLAGEFPVQSKVLDTPADPTTQTVLVGRSPAGGMIIQFELEPAKPMWMQMGNPLTWMEHPVGDGERYHVEVKPIDPKSKTRISFASVTFKAVNKDSHASVEGTLHPMWGGSGLHYAMNSTLVGDGIYEATVTVGVPGFARDLKAKDLWMQPATAKFHFKMQDDKLIEVTVPSAEISS